MKIFTLIPQNFNLGKKLTILMLAIFLGGIIISSFVYYNVLLGNAENELNRQANALISTMDSVRKYNADKVTPLLVKQSQEKILLEAIPSVAMTKVFDILTTSYPDKYGGYILKNAMINPTNRKDEATNEEKNVIEKLRQQDEKLSQKDRLAGENIDQGFLVINGEKKFYTARPIKITQNSCLKCHLSLEKSPPSLQALYEQGNYLANQGFGWELNKVIGTKIIYVPATKVYQTANKNFSIIILIFIAIFTVAIFLVNLWLKQYVVRPLNRITQVAKAISLGDMDADFEKQSNDEIGHLADAFGRMKASLQIAIKRLTKKNNLNQDNS